jgi:hypothetical protein
MTKDSLKQPRWRARNDNLRGARNLPAPTGRVFAVANGRLRLLVNGPNIEVRYHYSIP